MLNFSVASMYCCNLMLGSGSNLATATFRVPADDNPSLISATASGAGGNRTSGPGATSASGEVIAFASDSTDLIANDSNGCKDIFYWTALSGRLARVEPLDPERPGTRSEPNARSNSPQVTGDGRYIFFHSDASNFDAADSNQLSDVFCFNILDGKVTRISTRPTGFPAFDGAYMPSPSADGRRVVYEAVGMTGSVQGAKGPKVVVLQDLPLGAPRILSVAERGGVPDGESHTPAISGDGQFVCFSSDASNLVPNDTNGHADLFVWSAKSTALTRIGANLDISDPRPWSGWPTISHDGRCIAFLARGLGSDSTEPRIFVCSAPAWAASELRIAADQGFSYSKCLDLSVSADGGIVACTLDGVAIEPKQQESESRRSSKTQIVVTSTRDATFKVVSVAPDGSLANESCNGARIAADGRSVVFESLADNLIASMPKGHRRQIYRVTVSLQ